MDVQLKAIFLILLIGSIDAHRIAQISSMTLKVKQYSSELSEVDEAAATNKFMTRGCDNDVVVEARSFVDGHRKKTIGRLTNLTAHTSPVLVGSKERDGCKKTYSLVCQDDSLVLKKETKWTSNGCKAEIKSKTFGWLHNWESSAQKRKDTPFKFDPAFLQLAFPPQDSQDLECKRVIWTATEDHCEDATAEFDSQEDMVNSSISELDRATASGNEGQTKSAIQKLFRQLKSFTASMTSSKKNGCFATDQSEVTKQTKAKDSMSGKLRDLYISAKGKAIGEDAAAQRFDKSMEMMKESSRTRSMKGLMKAIRIAVHDTEESSEDTKEDAEMDKVDQVDLEDISEYKDVQEEVEQKFEAALGRSFAANAKSSSSLLQTSYGTLEHYVAAVVIIAAAVAIYSFIMTVAFLMYGLILGTIAIVWIKLAIENMMENQRNGYY